MNSITVTWNDLYKVHLAKDVQESLSYDVEHISMKNLRKVQQVALEQFEQAKKKQSKLSKKLSKDKISRWCYRFSIWADKSKLNTFLANVASCISLGIIALMWERGRSIMYGHHLIVVEQVHNKYICDAVANRLGKKSLLFDAPLPLENLFKSVILEKTNKTDNRDVEKLLSRAVFSKSHFQLGNVDRSIPEADRNINLERIKDLILEVEKFCQEKKLFRKINRNYHCCKQKFYEILTQRYSYVDEKVVVNVVRHYINYVEERKKKINAILDKEKRAKELLELHLEMKEVIINQMIGSCYGCNDRILTSHKSIYLEYIKKNIHGSQKSPEECIGEALYNRRNNLINEILCDLAQENQFDLASTLLYYQAVFKDELGLLNTGIDCIQDLARPVYVIKNLDGEIRKRFNALYLPKRIIEDMLNSKPGDDLYIPFYEMNQWFDSLFDLSMISIHEGIESLSCKEKREAENKRRYEEKMKLLNEEGDGFNALALAHMLKRLSFIEY